MLRAIIVALAVVVAAGCAAQARPATRYDAWNWWVSIPDDLGLAPSNRDADAVWLAGPQILTGSESSSTMTIRVTQLNAPGTDEEIVMAAARDAASSSGVEDVTEPRSRTFPAGAGSFFEARRGDSTFAIVYLFRDDTLVVFAASDLPLAEVEAIATPFRFREPPGDPLHPPSPSGTG